MNNYIQPGEVLTLTAPYAVSSGGGAYFGSGLFGIATADVASAADGEFRTCGVFTHAKTSAQAWSKWDFIYWDNTNKKMDNTPGVGPLIGIALAAADNPSSTGTVKLFGFIPPSGVNNVVRGSPTPTSINTAGAVTLTAAQLLSGIIVRDPNGGARTDVLPTAALLVAAVPGAKVGDIVTCKIINGADAAETITLQEGSGGGWDTNQTSGTRIIAQNGSKTLLVRLTNVTASSEAYVAYL